MNTRRKRLYWRSLAVSVAYLLILEIWSYLLRMLRMYTEI